MRSKTIQRHISAAGRGRDERHYHAFGKLTNLGNEEFWGALHAGFRRYIDLTIEQIGNTATRKCTKCGVRMPCSSVHKMVRDGQFAGLKVTWECRECNQCTIIETTPVSTLEEYYRQDNCR